VPFTEAVIEETQRFWQRRTGEAVAPDDARQAADNVSRLFELLAEWERAGSDTDIAVDGNDGSQEDRAKTRSPGG